MAARIKASTIDLVLSCGHRMYADTKRFAAFFGAGYLEFMCDSCGRWVTCHPALDRQLELNYGSETATEVMGKSQ